MASFDRPRLPQGWTEHIDPASGGYYYHHAVNNLTQWQRPTIATEATASTSQQPVHMKVQYCGG